MTARRLVVVGGSLAGFRAVEAARRAGFDGEVVLVSAEPHPPYDRPPLTKELLDPDRPPDIPAYLPGGAPAYRKLGVGLRLGEPARGLDPDARRVRVGDRELGYDALVIATGAHPRRPAALPRLPGVHVLRTVDDALAVRAALDAGARTVVVGGGFVGAEVASAARRRGLPVTVVEARATPLVRAVGERVGALCAAAHARAGTELRCGVEVVGAEGDGRVERVRLSDGDTLPADLLVVGVGAEPATGWLAGSGLPLRDGVVCDTTLSTGADGVFAAGDVMRWYNAAVGGETRLEHWSSAAEGAAVAGHNAVTDGPLRAFETIPYFWSDLYGARVQFVGVPDGDRVEVLGDPDQGRFAALYHLDGVLVGVLTVGWRPPAARFRALVRRRAGRGESLALAARGLA
ncbi:NAD(P)/FAD-dependent oxidoreductase [Streptomyces tendae]|uniref:NAD(P)/FAD-dependent oxidoreductase n=1 Tax=Streptomyces tendae TaxID=1932 RepID=UPI00371A525F